MERKTLDMDKKYEDRSDDNKKEHVDENQGKTVITGFYSETTESEVSQLSREMINEIGMDFECPAKSITHAFIHFMGATGLKIEPHATDLAERLGTRSSEGYTNAKNVWTTREDKEGRTQGDTELGASGRKSRRSTTKGTGRMWWTNTGGTRERGGRRENGTAQKRRGGKNWKGMGCGRRTYDAEADREEKAVGGVTVPILSGVCSEM